MATKTISESLQFEKVAPKNLSFSDMRSRIDVYRIELAGLKRKSLEQYEDELREQFRIAREQEIDTYRKRLFAVFAVASIALQFASILALTHPEIITSFAEKTNLLSLDRFKDAGQYNLNAISDTYSKTLTGADKIVDAGKHYWETGNQGNRQEASSNASNLHDLKNRQKEEAQRQTREIEDGLQDIERAQRSRAEVVNAITSR